MNLWSNPGYYSQLVKSRLRISTEVPLVLSIQRGLQYCTVRPIFKDPSPSGGGVSCIHGLTTCWASISVSLSISKYCCSCILYLICFIMFFSYPFVLMVYIVYSIYILIRIFLFLLFLYCYTLLLTIVLLIQHSLSVVRLFFNIRRVSLYTISFFLFGFHQYIEVLYG